jgi:hypothetical protein
MESSLVKVMLREQVLSRLLLETSNDKCFICGNFNVASLRQARCHFALIDSQGNLNFCPTPISFKLVSFKSKYNLDNFLLKNMRCKLRFRSAIARERPRGRPKSLPLSPLSPLGTQQFFTFYSKFFSLNKKKIFQL